jgi:hypothetical protein
MSIYKKLGDLNITLPELTPPVAAFVPYLRTGRGTGLRLFHH